MTTLNIQPDRNVEAEQATLHQRFDRLASQVRLRLAVEGVAQQDLLAAFGQVLEALGVEAPAGIEGHQPAAATESSSVCFSTSSRLWCRALSMRWKRFWNWPMAYWVKTPRSRPKGNSS